MGSQRGPALGPPSTAGQSKRSESKARSVTLLSGGGVGRACVLRSSVSNAGVREHSDLQFPDVVSLSDQVLRLPVKPSHRNYYERGFTKGFFRRARLDVNYFERRMDNFADDDQLLDTAVSFPIAFQKSNIYGAEGKLDLPYWGRLSGFVSCSYMVDSAFLPVTGGLFLGDVRRYTGAMSAGASGSPGTSATLSERASATRSFPECGSRAAPSTARACLSSSRGSRRMRPHSSVRQLPIE
jgi:hypothetical protein